MWSAIARFFVAMAGTPLPLSLESRMRELTRVAPAAWPMPRWTEQRLEQLQSLASSSGPGTFLTLLARVKLQGSMGRIQDAQAALRQVELLFPVPTIDMDMFQDLVSSAILVHGAGLARAWLSERFKTAYAIDIAVDRSGDPIDAVRLTVQGNSARFAFSAALFHSGTNETVLNRWVGSFQRFDTYMTSPDRANVTADIDFGDAEAMAQVNLGRVSGIDESGDGGQFSRPRGKERSMAFLPSLEVTPREAPDPGSLLWAWAVKETAHWLAIRPDRDVAHQRFRYFNETQPHVVLLNIADGRVSVADKSPEITAGSEWSRAEMYISYIRDVVGAFCPDLRCELLVDTCDARRRNDPVPVFGFQKPIGNNEIMLPDVDFFHFGFYDERPNLQHDTAFENKACSAIFVGSSSGGEIDTEVARTLSLPRLRAAAYFKENPHITFRITNIVQYDTQETKTILENAGFGGEPISWDEQLRHKFLISMDGNGATCSRVVIALKSNSVLLKYESPHELYYFAGMQRWVHYIPIYSDDDVIRIVEAERRQPGLFQHIAEAGKRFANTFLTRFSTMRYTASVLEHYNSAFSDFVPVNASTANQRLPEGANVRSGEISPLADVLVHIQDTGDTRFKPDGWIGVLDSAKWIEGLAIEAGPGVPRAEVEYKVVFPGGAMSDVTMAGEYAGSRNRNVPIIGFLLWLRGAAGDGYDGSYRALFTDGSTAGPVLLGDLCCSASQAPLQGFQISLKRKNR